MTAKENMEKVFRHEKTDWIAHLGSEAYGIRDYIVERPIMTTGYDAWGCRWISCPDSLNITHPDTSDIKLEDVTQWKDKVVFPDLEQIDFTPMKEEAAAFTERDSRIFLCTMMTWLYRQGPISAWISTKSIFSRSTRGLWTRPGPWDISMWSTTAVVRWIP